MKKIKLEDIKFILLSFVIAFLIVGIIYAIVGYYPFGNNTIMRVDLYHQYGPFHEEFKSKLLNGSSLFYSWEGGLGKELITQIAYYTSSPISFLMLLFPQRLLPEAMAFFAMIKIALSAAFFSIYLKVKFKRNDITIVAFSVMYAFMSYVSSYYWNVMWLDAIVLFPMVALGIEKLVEEDKPLFYGIFLTLSIIVNFYIAFIVCVFSVLYFAVVLFSKYSIKKEKKIIISKIVKFIVMSGLAGGICMVLAIPTAIALSRTATSDTSFPTLKIYENIYQIITNHFLGARPVVLARNEDLPNVYCGVLTMLLFPFFFANRKIELKEKVLFAIFLLFMIVCSCVNTFDYLIHGAHFPSNLPHRYTFIYCFMLIMLAYRAFNDLKNIEFKHVWKFFGFYVAVMLITELLIAPNYSEIERVLDDKELIINIILMLVYIFVLKQFVKKHNNANIKTASYMLSAIIMCEALFAGYSGLDYVGTTDRGKYVQYMDGTNEILNYIKQTDHDEDKFYRQEFRRFSVINEGSLYHYNGFSQFSSLAGGDTSEFIGNLGIAATGNSYRFYDLTPMQEAMFNIKYVMNKDKPIEKENYELIHEFVGANETEEKDDTKINTMTYNSGSVYLYKSSKFLPLGFMVNKEIEEWDTTEGNPFDVQNSFAKTATGINDELLTKLPVDEISYDNIKITDREENINKYNYELSYPSNLNAIPKVTTTVHNDKDTEQHVYLYIDAGNAKRVKYTINGNTEDRELSAGKSLFDCGNIPAKTDIDISFTLDRKGEYEKTYRTSGNFKILAATFNNDVYDKVFNELNSNTMTVNDYGDTYINGTVNGGEGGLLFTSIPYDDGWKITIDGEKAELVPIAGKGVIGVEVGAGEHHIEFKYVPKGFIEGCAVSGLSLVLFIGYAVFINKKRKKELAA